MQSTQHKSFHAPEERRDFPHGHADILRFTGGEVGRLVFEPGWRWSRDVKPIAQTDSCQAPHFQYQVSGQLAIRMDDGVEMIAKPAPILIWRLQSRKKASAANGAASVALRVAG